jgi:hypothetical protein
MHLIKLQLTKALPGAEQAARSQSLREIANLCLKTKFSNNISHRSLLKTPPTRDPRATHPEP